VRSDLYQRFWEQLVGWAMRTAETGRLTVRPEYREGRVRVVVEAHDERDRPLTGITLRGKVTPPRPPAPGEKPPAAEFVRTAAGRFEAEFPAEEAGSYFVYVQALQNGQIIDGARAGVAVPYSPEFADLETNPAFLRRLAEVTDGSVYNEDDEELLRVARSGELFREAPKTVRSLLPFWFWLVFAAGVLLVFDVGVRRVSVEPAEVRVWAARAWARLRSRQQAEAEGQGLDRLLKVKEAVGEQIDRDRTGRRFEPAAGPPAGPVRTADEDAARRAGDQSSGGLTSPGSPGEQPKPEQPADDFFTRMREAKRRAQQDRPEGDRE
jgi:hypothetical protein